MKAQLFNYLVKPYSVVVVILIATLLSLQDRNLGYFFGLGVVFFTVWQKKWDWSYVGIGQKLNLKTIINSTWISILFFFVPGIIDTILQYYLGNHDLSSLNDTRGDFGSYAIMMVIMWVFAAFGEEVLFHGYYMQRFAKLFGDTKKVWILSGILIAVYFGISHGYQGLSGIIGVGIGSLFFALLYYKNKSNLLLLVLIHGIYDSIWLTLIYLNIDSVVNEWFQQLLF
ncbi:CPBP family intramembrane glutamic endopeptidase [uncultured Maribacter sp.]|uniref:CPBP family intramembrane glutamic endopeptidase n=1 Tax=uncultured Maribacter sp. TaxID=431308 RepID=UPI0030D86399|tara:strand:+ start:1075 stop:1755 length:681 start_codon:yes stop_codon:yes gene_type:complete